MPSNPLIPPKRHRVREPNKLRGALHDPQHIRRMARRLGDAVGDAGDPEDDVEDGVGVEEHCLFDGAGALFGRDDGGRAVFGFVFARGGRGGGGVGG